MTRIVLDPNELKRIADQMAEAALAYAKIASTLQQRELPEMPPTLADAVSNGLTRAAGRLHALGGRLDASGVLLRQRAASVDGDVTDDMLLSLSRDLNG